MENNYNKYTSAEEVMRHRAFIYLSACWFVRKIIQKLQADLSEIFRKGWTRPKLEVIRFWWRSG